MSIFLQVVGLVLITAGFGLAWLPLAPIVFGVGLLTLGALMERDTPTEP